MLHIFDIFKTKMENISMTRLNASLISQTYVHCFCYERVFVGHDWLLSVHVKCWILVLHEM